MSDDPEAMRYGFDGFGYKYIDSGSGSDWRTRHPDAEPLYVSQPTQSDDDAYELGKRDGYESAVQDIDMLTGGDGEYRYSTIGGERHCPDADSMKARIAERFNSQPTQSDAVLDGDALPILYLLGVKHGQEDERAKIAAEANQPKTVTVTVVSAADGKAIHKFKIDPTKKTIVRPEHSLFGYVFEPEEEQSK
jgi:hypothetical protein